MTAAMKRALDCVLTFVSLHGAMPSVRALASDLGCHASNARRTMKCLAERGELSRLGNAGPLALGGAGIPIIVPAPVAAVLARYCLTHNENASSVAADAIALHLDQLETTCEGEAQ